MIVSSIIELNVRGVFDRGHPNLERIAIYVNSPLNIGQYGIMIGIKGDAGSAFPIKDHMFWFGDGYLSAGDWIFIYTGAGSTSISNIPGGGSKLYSVHWGKPATLFHAAEIVPILFKVDAVLVPQETPQLPVTTRK